jgi:membrane protein required for colicin V production
MPVSILDIIIATPILIFLIAGFRNGFIEEFVGLVGQVLAIFLAFTYMSNLAELIQEYLGAETVWIAFFSFIGIYLVAIFTVRMLIKLIESVLKIAQLSVVNLIFGGIFSGLKGALLVSTFMIVLAVIGQPTKRYTQDSLLYSYVVPVAPITYNLISRLLPGVGEFKDQMGAYLKDMDITSILLGEETPTSEPTYNL